MYDKEEGKNYTYCCNTADNSQFLTLFKIYEVSHKDNYSFQLIADTGKEIVLPYKHFCSELTLSKIEAEKIFDIGGDVVKVIDLYANTKAFILAAIKECAKTNPVEIGDIDLDRITGDFLFSYSSPLLAAFNPNEHVQFYNLIRNEFAINHAILPYSQLSLNELITLLVEKQEYDMLIGKDNPTAAYLNEWNHKVKIDGHPTVEELVLGMAVDYFKSMYPNGYRDKNINYGDTVVTERSSLLSNDISLIYRHQENKGSHVQALKVNSNFNGQLSFKENGIEPIKKIGTSLKEVIETSFYIDYEREAELEKVVFLTQNRLIIPSLWEGVVYFFQKPINLDKTTLFSLKVEEIAVVAARYGYNAGVIDKDDY